MFAINETGLEIIIEMIAAKLKHTFNQVNEKLYNILLKRF